MVMFLNNYSAPHASVTSDSTATTRPIIIRSNFLIMTVSVFYR
jgi:hypothetical protein